MIIICAKAGCTNTFDQPYKSGRKKVFCSTKCRNGSRYPEPVSGICVCCGELFQKRKHGESKKLCSTKCKSKFRIRTAEDRRIHNARYYAKPDKIIAKKERDKTRKQKQLLALRIAIRKGFISTEGTLYQRRSAAIQILRHTGVQL